MKLSVSVPDELWLNVSARGTVGPSEVVQRALRLLELSEKEAERPMARAPSSTDLASYAENFNSAADLAAMALHTAPDAGYRVGLELSHGLQPDDLAALDDPGLEGIRYFLASGDDHAHTIFDLVPRLCVRRPQQT